MSFCPSSVQNGQSVSTAVTSQRYVYKRIHILWPQARLSGRWAVSFSVFLRSSVVSALSVFPIRFFFGGVFTMRFRCTYFVLANDHGSLFCLDLEQYGMWIYFWMKSERLLIGKIQQQQQQASGRLLYTHLERNLPHRSSRSREADSKRREDKASVYPPRPVLF